MKKISILFCMLISIFCLAACAKDSTDTFDTSAQNETEKLHDDVAAENIRYVTISGNARSIVIRQSEDENFSFFNKDLKTEHVYQVKCAENGDTLDISAMMENAEADNDILGSVWINIPQKEFEKIEITGDFRQISLYTVNSNVLIHDSCAFVNLDLEAEHIKHNITLDGSESNTFRGVSVYLDKVPDHVKMELTPIQGGTINDPENILKKGELESGVGEPAISINNTKEINIYRNE